MNLRHLMPNHAILAMLVPWSIGVVGLTAPASVESAESRPNVIVIISDDQGYADLGLHNFRKDIKTPNLDQLARGGVLFTDGYVTAPQCSPGWIADRTLPAKVRTRLDFRPASSSRGEDDSRPSQSSGLYNRHGWQVAFELPSNGCAKGI